MKRFLNYNLKVFLLISVMLSGVSGLFAQSRDTIAIIDAGSSGSRLFVYCIENNKTLKKIYPQKAEESGSKGKALSKVTVHKDSVRAYVNDMTSKYKVSNKVPLYILATAGMRQVDKNDAKTIYNCMTGEYNNFKIEKAMTISGRYEGLYAWIAANYQEGRLGFNTSTPDKPLTYSGKPYGIVEIGGASMQIAFPLPVPAPSSLKKEKRNLISRKGFSNIYSKSYLGGGVDQIYNIPKNANKIKKDFPKINQINFTFLGLGKPIGIVLDSVKNHNTFDKYIDSIKEDDTPENYHPKSNAEYMKELFGDTIPQNLTKSKNDISWTEGAAIDIVINKEEPEAFNYDSANPN